MTRPRLLSLFSGIGAMDYALERAGFECVLQCESDPFCRAVLRKHWPHVPCVSDVRSLSRADIAGPIDLVAGGPPCQPHSVAGNRLGQADARHLWPDMARIIREFRPAWALVENVPGIRTTAADEILRDLESEGYACGAVVVGAEHVGAPHRRHRVWIVGQLAYSASQRQQRREGDAAGREPHRSDAGREQGEHRTPGHDPADVADANQLRRKLERIGGLLDSERTALRHDVDGCDCAPVADANRATSGFEPGRGAGQDGADAAGAGGSGEGFVGNSSGGGLAQWTVQPENDGKEQPSPQRAGVQWPVADPDELRERESKHAISPEPRRDARDDASGDRLRWPSRPGQPQHKWEAPRLTQFGVGGSASRSAERLVRFANRCSLKALGNAVVWQIPCLIGRWMLEESASVRVPGQ